MKGEVMRDPWTDQFQEKLIANRNELRERLVRIEENHRRPLARNSTERAAELENRDVIDALGNEARVELGQIATALERIEALEYGACDQCGDPIREERLLACPHADKCIGCATDEAPVGANRSASGR